MGIWSGKQGANLYSFVKAQAALVVKSVPLVNVGGLGLTTGHGIETPANLEDALGRLIDPDTLRRCFGCHTTASTTTAGFDPAHLMPGVTCEACHGPGAKHVALMDEEKNDKGRSAIFNPKRLNAIALVDFCGACHRTLNDVYEMGAAGVANVRFQPYRLEKSRCWGDGDRTDFLYQGE